MDLNVGQSKTTSVLLLSWTILLTVLSFSFLTYVNIRERTWLQVNNVFKK